LIQDISANNNLIADVSLKDSYKDSRTFHITYQDLFKNLTTQEVEKIREKIISSLEKNFAAKIK
jgi:phenylalanyl-tRNA synthetase beta subunit